MAEPPSIAQQIEHVARALADAERFEAAAKSTGLIGAAEPAVAAEIAALAAAGQTLKAVPGLLRAAERVLEDATALPRSTCFVIDNGPLADLDVQLAPFRVPPPAEAPAPAMGNSGLSAQDGCDGTLPDERRA